MYDTLITLKMQDEATYDEYGNEVLTYKDNPVFAMPRSVYSAEFYSAAQAGIHPSITFELSNRADYDGQKLVEWEGRLYDVVRADWRGQKDKLSLICEERVKNG